MSRNWSHRSSHLYLSHLANERHDAVTNHYRDAVGLILHACAPPKGDVTKNTPDDAAWRSRHWLMQPQQGQALLDLVGSAVRTLRGSATGSSDYRATLSLEKPAAPRIYVGVAWTLDVASMHVSERQHPLGALPEERNPLLGWAIDCKGASADRAFRAKIITPAVELRWRFRGDNFRASSLRLIFAENAPTRGKCHPLHKRQNGGFPLTPASKEAASRSRVELGSAGVR
ncbi:hypothetical protein G7046_g8371 [Stylonectria norvegica]|nr:hypothetical protein G7046_g8371 [Stylonectria norvegica]